MAFQGTEDGPVLADFLGLVAWLLTVSRFTLGRKRGACHDCGYRD